MKTSLLIHPEELDKAWIDKIAKYKYDTLSLHPRGGRKATETLIEMLGMLEDEEYKAKIDYAKSLGLKIEYEFHSMGYLLPRDLFEEHPEYFRVNENGERVNDYNLCVSNNEALEIVGDRAKELAKKLYKSEHNYYFWADDVKGSYCNCVKCKKYTPAEQNLIIMNKIYDKISSIIPDAKVACLAYQDTIDVIKKVKKKDGVFLEYAPIERSFDKPYIDQGKENIEKIEQLISFFGKKDSKVLEYWFDNSMFSNWQKPVKEFKANEYVIKEDVKMYKELGFEYISSFACFLGWDYTELYGDAKIVSLN